MTSGDMVTVFYDDERIAFSEKAFMVFIQRKAEWFPRRLCTIRQDVKMVMCPKWLADKKGFIYLKQDREAEKPFLWLA